MIPVQDSIFQGHSLSSCPVEVFAESRSQPSALCPGIGSYAALSYIHALSQCFMVLFNVQVTMTSLQCHFISSCITDKNKCLIHGRIFASSLESSRICFVAGLSNILSSFLSLNCYPSDCCCVLWRKPPSHEREWFSLWDSHFWDHVTGAKSLTSKLMSHLCKQQLHAALIWESDLRIWLIPLPSTSGKNC